MKKISLLILSSICTLSVISGCSTKDIQEIPTSSNEKTLTSEVKIESHLEDADIIEASTNDFGARFTLSFDGFWDAYEKKLLLNNLIKENSAEQVKQLCSVLSNINNYISSKTKSNTDEMQIINYTPQAGMPADYAIGFAVEENSQKIAFIMATQDSNNFTAEPYTGTLAQRIIPAISSIMNVSLEEAYNLYLGSLEAFINTNKIGCYKNVCFSFSDTNSGNVMLMMTPVSDEMKKKLDKDRGIQELLLESHSQESTEETPIKHQSLLLKEKPVDISFMPLFESANDSTKEKSIIIDNQIYYAYQENSITTILASLDINTGEETKIGYIDESKGIKICYSQTKLLFYGSEEGNNSNLMVYDTQAKLLETIIPEFKEFLEKTPIMQYGLIGDWVWYVTENEQGNYLIQAKNIENRQMVLIMEEKKVEYSDETGYLWGEKIYTDSLDDNSLYYVMKETFISTDGMGIKTRNSEICRYIFSSGETQVVGDLSKLNIDPLNLNLIILGGNLYYFDIFEQNQVFLIENEKLNKISNYVPYTLDESCIVSGSSIYYTAASPHSDLLIQLGEGQELGILQLYGASVDVTEFTEFQAYPLGVYKGKVWYQTDSLITLSSDGKQVDTDLHFYGDICLEDKDFIYCLGVPLTKDNKEDINSVYGMYKIQY